ncbi:MAG: hypothetical protein Q3998_01640 [Porphyromonas sp.]|nr:hypothetical protein [Porphyromonas sp.]
MDKDNRNNGTEQENLDIIYTTEEHMTDIGFDDEELPEVEGMTLVDAYYVENHMVEYYIEQREHFAKEIAKTYAKAGYNAERRDAGNDEGEAVMAIDRSGKVVGMILLNPYETDNLIAAKAEGTLTEEILRSLKNNHPKDHERKKK